MIKKLFVVIIGLILSGCVTTPQGDGNYYTDQELLSAGAKQIRGNDIVGIVSGNTLYGRYLDHVTKTDASQDGDSKGDASQDDASQDDERRWVEFVANDGRVAYYDFKQLIQGNWQINTDLICFSYRMQIPQPDNCFVVYELGEKHYFVSVRQQTMGQVVSVVLGRKNGNAAGLDLK